MQKKFKLMHLHFSVFFTANETEFNHIASSAAKELDIQGHAGTDHVAHVGSLSWFLGQKMND